MLKLQDIAKRYMAQGFNVIPILPEQKKPAQKWMEFNDRKAEPLELQTWFAGKQSNIGIVTGEISKVVVVDIDKPELFNEFVKEYPTHRIQRTASGGYHLLYRYSGKDIGNSVSRLSNGIDVRGNHGYIVTYPSVIRLANGGLGEYHWQEEGELLPLPVPLHDLIIKELGAYKVELAAGTDGKDLWTDVLNNGFTPGKHNEQVKDLARFFYRMHMPEDVIITTLELLNLQDETPLPQNELHSTIKSGINYEKTRLQLKQDETKTEHETDQMTVRWEAHKKFKREWLIEDWLLKNSIMVLTAPPEQYKTWVALEAAVQIALGNKSSGFLGGSWQGPKEPMAVLIVQQEDNEDLVMERLKAIAYEKIIDKEGWEETAKNMPIFFPKDDLLSFDDKESMQALEDRIVKHNIKFVIIDPLYSLASSDDFFAGMAKQMLKIKKLRNKHGVTFLFVHHNKKGTTGLASIDDLEREGMYGSQLLNGAFEGMWLINTLKENKTRIIGRTGKSFIAETSKEKWILKFDINTDTSTGEILVDGMPVINEGLKYKVTLERPKGLELSPDQELMRDALLSMTRGTVSGIIMKATGKQPSSRLKREFMNLVESKIFVEIKGGKHNGEYEMGNGFQ